MSRDEAVYCRCGRHVHCRHCDPLPDCICGHSRLFHDNRFGTCYETGDDRCNCYMYTPPTADTPREDKP